MSTRCCCPPDRCTKASSAFFVSPTRSMTSLTRAFPARLRRVNGRRVDSVPDVTSSRTVVVCSETEARCGTYPICDQAWNWASGVPKMAISPLW